MLQNKFRLFLWSMLFTALLVFSFFYQSGYSPVGYSTALPINPTAFEYVTSYGSPGTAPGQFQNETDVAMIPGTSNIVIADTGNNRIQIFNQNGVEISYFGKYGSELGNFSSPQGVAANTTNIFVADTGNNRVEIFDISGNFKSSFGSLGSGNTQFNQPTGIAVDGSNIYVADSGNKRVQVFDMLGNYVSTIGDSTVFKSPQKVALFGGSLFVTDIDNSSVCVFDYSHTRVKTLTGIGSSSFNAPVGVTVDSNGWIMISDKLTDLIHVIDLSFTFDLVIGGNGLMNNVYGITQNETNLFTTDGSGEIDVFAVVPYPTILSSHYNTLTLNNTIINTVTTSKTVTTSLYYQVPTTVYLLYISNNTITTTTTEKSPIPFSSIILGLLSVIVIDTILRRKRKSI